MESPAFSCIFPPVFCVELFPELFETPPSSEQPARKMIEISAQGIRNLREEIISEDYPRDMADKKASRLINLTMALLATKRYLKKSEIFRLVEGYEGSAESMDRMFERDKNELRGLGIEISVGDLDPLFEDEPGYKILQSDYAFQLGVLNQRELALLASAAKIWNDAVIGKDAQSSLRKIEGVSEFFDEYDVPLNLEYEIPGSELQNLEMAIKKSQKIELTYNGKTRQIEPHRLVIWRGFWYLIGREKDSNEFKIFKLSRISGGVTLLEEKFSIDPNIEISKLLPSEDNYEVVLKIPIGLAQVLRSKGDSFGSFGEYDLYKIHFPTKDSAIGQILKYGANCQVDSPLDLRNEIVDILKVLSND